MTIAQFLLNVAGQALLGVIITVGFGMLFNVPRNILPYSALVGASGHVIRYSLRQFGLSNEIATFFGAFAVGMIGYAFARMIHQPRLPLTVTGIISMVPGIPAYETIIYFSRGETLEGLQSAIRAAGVSGAIAIGLTTARLLTEADARFQRI
jgi:uncharacterized membrane protein YjjB (DUF3815 family)